MMSDSGAKCLNSLHESVSPGKYFTPFGSDICEKCKCLAGKAVGCFWEKCLQRPECSKYQPIQGTCCEFECLEDNGLSDKTELAVLFSLITGLVLLLIILILVLYYRRQGIKKCKEEETSEMTKSTITATEQPQPNTTRSSGAITSSVENTQVPEERVELPPPYSPAPQTSSTEVKSRNRTPPNEPPPPYADREESAV